MPAMKKGGNYKCLRYGKEPPSFEGIDLWRIIP